MHEMSHKNPFWLIGTLGGVGRSPVAPGTCGAFVTLPFAWAIQAFFGTQGLMIAVVVLFFVGWMAAHYVCVEMADSDPQEVVIDESVGQLIALFFIPMNWHWYVVAFILFRAFDIIKPWPINYVETRFDNGFGVMLDDVVAGFFALCSVQVIYLIVTLIVPAQ